MNTIKTKILGITLLSSVSILSSFAQNVGDFTGIKVGDSFTVKLSQSEANTIKIDASDEVKAKIKTEVKEGVLFIESDGNNAGDAVISVGIKSLTTLAVLGAADVKTENQLICDKLIIESSGAGDVHLDLKAADVSTTITGAGDVTLKGSSQQLTATVSGAGDLKAADFEVDKVTAKVSGAGDAKVNVKQSITANVSGAGSVIYKGNPVDRNVEISGAGSVRESTSGTGDETASDTTKIKLGNKKYLIIDDEESENNWKKLSRKDSIRNYNEDFKNWAGFELGVNGLLDYKNSLEAPAGASFLELDYSKSIQFGLNLFEKDFHIYKNYINLVTGFGFDFNHYAFKNNITLNPDTTYLSATTDALDYKKNKLNVSYIKAPLLIDINMSKNANKNFHIAAGVEFAYRIHSVTKQRYDVGDTHFKNKTRDDFNIEPFRYSAVARIGYNNVTIFANYGLNRLFQKNKGPQVYPFTLGVTFSFS
jgi:hypothetical protein